MTGGYTMFIKDNRLYYDYNFLNGVHYILKSAPLPMGKTDLKFNFIRTKPFGGEGELYVNGEKVDEVEMSQMHIATYSLAETFDVGRDTGTQVSEKYSGVFRFSGRLDRVIFTVSDENTVPPRRLPAMYY
jgi:arylsulfatase